MRIYFALMSFGGAVALRLHLLTFTEFMLWAIFWLLTAFMWGEWMRRGQ
jgi:hypothetical protein